MPDRTRTISWQDPIPGFQRSTDLSGIEYLRLLLSGELPPPPISKLLGFSLVEVEPGRAVFESTPGEEHYNPIGVVHGGLAATLLDSAMGCAIQSMLPQGAGYTTLEIKVNYIRPITAETGRLRCEAKMIHVGGRTASAEGRAVDESGKLYPH